MPGPALTVQINADTSELAVNLDSGTSKLGGFIDNVTGIITSMGGITGVADLAVQGLQKLVEIGGPEAKAAMDDLQAGFDSALTPVLAELSPLIVDLIKGLTEIMTTIMPVLVPLLIGFIERLRGVMDVVGKVWEALQPLIDRLMVLWTEVLQPLAEVTMPLLVDAMTALIAATVPFIAGFVDVLVKGFDTVVGAIQAIIDIVSTVQHVLQDLMDAIAGALGTIQDLLDKLASITSFQLPSFDVPDVLPGWIPHSAPPAPGFAGITVNTMSDPAAVTRALRRYSADNGGNLGRARRGSVQLRGW